MLLPPPPSEPKQGRDEGVVDVCVEAAGGGSVSVVDGAASVETGVDTVGEGVPADGPGDTLVGGAAIVAGPGVMLVGGGLVEIVDGGASTPACPIACARATPPVTPITAAKKNQLCLRMILDAASRVPPIVP